MQKHEIMIRQTRKREMYIHADCGESSKGILENFVSEGDV